MGRGKLPAGRSGWRSGSADAASGMNYFKMIVLPLRQFAVQGGGIFGKFGNRRGMFPGIEPVRSRNWQVFGLAVGLPLAGYAARVVLGDVLVGYPYATFYPVILMIAVLARPLASVLAVGLSAVLAAPFAVDSNAEFLPQSLSAWIGLSLFLAVSGMIVWLLHALRSALDSATEARAALTLANRHLEERVALRTRELTEANQRLLAETEARVGAEAQARQGQKMEAIGQLSGGVAHDFNNMLAIIMGSLHVAKRRLERGDTDVVQFLDGALEGAGRAAGLTQRLLAFSRKQPLTPEVADMNALVRGLDELLRRSLGETVRLELALGGGLWRTRVDKGQVENALVNLAINARDAMPDGGKLTIETMNAFLDDAYASAHDEVTPGQYVLLAVSDAGVGMTRKVMERAFDPFFTTKDAGKGTGLGLSQVYGFVKQSGGHIKIYSEPGQGTTIKIYLARHYGEGEVRADVVLDAEVPMGRPSVSVLVVEDDDAVREIAVGILRELGYTVEEAASGYAALRMMEAGTRFTLLFTDVVMPGMSGRMLAEAALRVQPDLRVIYTTGYTANAIVHNGMVDPGVELLTKPYSLEQLARKMQRVLQG
ncbi:hybrid sensor histidine kinase/response regulator [Gemmobacter aquarius]|uniref:histidine kinase n=2 Tax=Paragemmobacter aquarius TaxID=2169400 RepID=A0A2S0UNC1_9RHOB|nr:hybrid sensor histidine kinase/response regulator [Gemmobacter aquarius]